MNAIHSTHKSKSKPSWPPILQREYPSGKTAFQIAVMVDGKRIRETFKTRAEAEARAQEIRAMRQREGAAAFTLPMEHRVEAAKSLDKLRPYNATIAEAVDYYVEHVLLYKREADIVPPGGALSYIHVPRGRSHKPNRILFGARSPRHWMSGQGAPLQQTNPLTGGRWLLVGRRQQRHVARRPVRLVSRVA
ncbi:MAG: hypothetical protein ABSA97_12215 [Verrucomicrobiia bacterium]